ncbi:hypothetical protein IQ07DRAFT_198656 [Pyrenochaeta sp. DS3sAY3a]|nr:hypothetical protein IQ07DRAFT_198656 [Pyrenochaeta sp. DS3sAY3a]
MDSIKPLQDEVSKALVSTTRSASRINAADIVFQRSLNPQVGAQLDAQNARLLHLAQRLLGSAATSSDAVGPKLPDVEAIDADWRGVVDVIDSLLEKADISLDEFTGVVKRLVPTAEQAAAKPRPNIAEKKILPKPQLNFEHAPNNHEVGGFRPLLVTKPHAIFPLDQCLKTFKDNRDREQYPHPYQAEIESYEYPPSVYESSEPQQYPPFESTTATLVDTPEALATMLTELKTAKEIAIDLEHHDNRSYIGLVSLMQISTRDKDWIVDTLQPWRRKLECLNQVFANPSILKVLHGAYMDIIWLQRDLGLYVVGLFDTFHAARSLGYPGASLAYLLSRFVNFTAQKQYQLADWRVRPLPHELFEYARADTHFLLYVYDNMRNELLAKSDLSDPEKNKIQDVLLKSKEVALQRYEHPIYDTEFGLDAAGWYKLITRTPVQFTPQQFSVFRAVHKWRDDLARAEDESPLFIMPNHAVFSIARLMPVDKAALYNAIQHVSPVIRVKADELVHIIAKAKQLGANGPELDDVLKKIGDMRRAEIAAKHDAPQTNSPASTAPVAQQVTPISAGADPATRASASNFWGKLWHFDAAEQRREMSTINVDLALPLPPLTAELFAEKIGSVNSTPKDERPRHTFVPKDERPEEDQRTDMFVVKQLGGLKRKRDDGVSQPLAALALDPMTNDEIMLDPEENDAAAEEVEAAPKEDDATLRAQEKAARKAARKQKKKDQAATAAALNDEPAFDYANAQSILHAEDGDGKKKSKKDKKKKGGAFDPFKGMGDAPKGLPRTQKEVAGRSRTFQS